MSDPATTPPTPLPRDETGLLRVAVGAAGGVLIGSAPRDWRTGWAGRGLGLALVGAALRPFVTELIRDIGDRRRQVAMCASIDIERSVADVFAFFNDFENFPRVIGNLRTVVDFQDGRAHWSAYTPSGRIVEWDTTITKYLPRSVIAWESIVESEVRMRATVRVTSILPIRTRVDLEIEYCPPHSGVSDAIRALFGPAQEHRLQRDLEHARDCLESIVPGDAATPIASPS